FFGLFNRGFEALARGYGRLTARIVRFAVLMLFVYAGVIPYGLNQFRKASPPPPDAVNRQVVDTALQVPGVVHAVNFAGFSGATFTNAPNSGAIFLPLEPFEQRARDPSKSASATQGALL